MMKLKARKGATFIEYALLVGLVAIVVIGAAVLFGDEIRGFFSKSTDTTHEARQYTDKAADNAKNAIEQAKAKMDEDSSKRQQD